MHSHSYHKILDKQIASYLEKNPELSDDLDVLFKSIARTYQAFERDKMLAEHAFAVSEKEYQEVLHNISSQNAIITQSIGKLKNAIIALDPESGFIFDNTGSGAEIISIIDFLEQQILRTKKLETELIAAKNQAEKASHAKGEFLSVMSHEIRTPLNAIIGLSYVMLSSGQIPLSQKNNIETLHISAQNLLLLINDILDFNKIEEGKIILSKTSVDLAALVKDIKYANNQQALERANNIRLMVDQDIPAHVSTDDIRLNQIINNLVTNAIKFTKNGTVTIELSLVSETSDTATIKFSVADTGIGIAEDKKHVIFDHFTQADAHITRSFGGSGLGLAIVKKLLNLFNSEIHLESEIGKGSVFSFTIRFEKAYAEKESNRRDLLVASDEFSNKKILLVEDVEFNILFTEQILKTWGASIDIAYNGLEAVNKVKNENFDLILMDIRMPVMDGFTATREIRTFNHCTPVIALTASASSEMLERIDENGFNGHLLKPFAPKDLNKILGKFLKC